MPQDDRPITLEEFEEQRRKHYGIPTGLAASLRQQESGGRQYDQTGGVLTSPKKAKGRYQVLKSTAAQYELDPDDPYENIEASFRYLSDLNKQVDAKVADPGERWAQTLAGYHAGEGRLREVNKTGSLPATSDGLIRTDEYVASIMKRWQQHDSREGTQEPQPKPQKPSVDPARNQRLTEMVTNFEALKRQGSRQTAAELALEIRREFGDVMEVGVGDGRWPYVKPKADSGVAYDPKKLVPAKPFTPEEAEQQARQTRQRASAPPAGSFTGAVHQFIQPVIQGAAGLPEGAAELVRSLGSVQELSPRIRESERRAGKTDEQIDAEFAARLAAQRAREQQTIEQNLRPLAERGAAFAARVAPVDVTDESWLTAKIPRALGSTVVPAAATILTGGNPFVGGMVGAAQNAQQIAREFDAAGVDPARRDRAIQFAGATGLTEMFGVTRALSKFGLSRPFLKRAVDVLEESGQEGLQQYLNNVNAAMVGAYDPNRPLSKDVLESAILGGIVGGGVQAASAGAQRVLPGRESAQAPRPPVPATFPAQQQPTAAPEAAPQPTPSARPAEDKGLEIVQYVDQIAEIESAPILNEEREAAKEAVREEYIARRRSGLPEDVQKRLTQPEVQFFPQQRVGARAQAPTSLARDEAREEFAQEYVDALKLAEESFPPGPERDAAMQEAKRAFAFNLINNRTTAAAKSGGAILTPPSSQELVPETFGYIPQRKALPPATGEEIIPAPPPQSRAVREVISQPSAQTAQTRAMPPPVAPPPPAPPPTPTKAEQDKQQRNRTIIASRDIAEKARQEADAAVAQGRFADAREALKRHKQAVSDLRRLIPPQNPGAVKLRDSLGQQMRAVDGQLADINRTLREQNKQPRGRAKPVDPNAPTAGLATPLLDQVNTSPGVVPIDQLPSQTFTQRMQDAQRAAERQQRRESLEEQQRRRSDARKENMRLEERIRGLGGIDPDVHSGELISAIDRRRPGFINRRSGVKPDRLREMLIEDGYLPEEASIDDLFRLIDSDISGSPVYPIMRRLTGDLVDEEAEYYARQEAELRRQEGEPARTGLTKQPREAQIDADVQRLRGTSPQTNEQQSSKTEVRPQAPAYGRVEGVPQGIPETRPTGGQRNLPRAPEGLTQEPSALRTESLRVPKATPQNIAQLRDRRDKLAREEHNRGGRLTGDLADEMQELGSRIAEFENAQAQAERGGLLEEAPPAGTRAGGRPFAQPTTEDRRRAFEAAEARLDAEIGRATGTLPQEDADALERGVATIDALFAAVEEDADVADLFARAAEGDTNAETEFRNYADKRHGIDADTLNSVLDTRRNAKERGRVREVAGTRPTASRTQTRDARYGEDRPTVKAPPQAQDLSAQDLNTLNENPDEVTEDDFDQYRASIEDLSNRQIRGLVEMPDWAARQLDARLKQSAEIRRQRVKEKRLPARFKPAPTPAKPLSKEEGGRRLVEQARQREAERPVEKTPEAQSQTFDWKKWIEGVDSSESFKDLLKRSDSDTLRAASRFAVERKEFLRNEQAEREKFGDLDPKELSPHIFNWEETRASIATELQSRHRRESAGQSAVKPEEPRTVLHPDPAIDGKPVIAETADGKVIVSNPENKGGVSVVRDRGPEGTRPLVTQPLSSVAIKDRKRLIGKLMPFNIQGNKADLLAKGLGPVIERAAKGTKRTIDAFGGTGAYTHYLRSRGISHEGDILNEFDPLRYITHKQLKENPKEVAQEAARTLTEVRQLLAGVTEGERFGEKHEAVRRQIADYFQRRLNALVAPGENVRQKARAGEPVEMQDTPETAGLYLIMQEQAFNFLPIQSEVTDDRVIEEQGRMFSAPLKAPHFRLPGFVVIFDDNRKVGLFKGKDRTFETAARAEGAGQRMQGVDVRRGDGWELIRKEAGKGDLVPVDTSYLNRASGEETQNYSQATAEDAVPEVYMEKVRTNLLPAWDRGAKLIVTNNWDKRVAEFLRSLGFDVVKATRQGASKEDIKTGGAAELVAINFDKKTGEIFKRPTEREDRPMASVQRGNAIDAQIADRMRQIARTPTSPVQISKLRAEFPELSKSDFDAAMMKLAEDGRIFLHRHDHPAGLRDADRAALVRDGDKYFIAATFNESKPMASVQRGAAIKGRSQHWNTPPVPRTPSGFLVPLTKEQKAEQFEHSRAEFRQHATRARVYTNEQGAFTYAAAINRTQGDGDAIPIAIDGVAVPLNGARKVVRYLLDRIAEKQSPARKEVYNNLAHALEQAVKAAERRGDAAITIVSTEVRQRDQRGILRRSFEGVRQVATHEETHVWQMNVGGLVRRGLFSDEAITSDPDYEQQRKALIRVGYPRNMSPDDVSAEAVAHAVASQWRDLGYKSEDGAKKYLARVFDRAYTELGADAVESLRLRTPKSKEAREDVRARRTDGGVGRGPRPREAGRTVAGGEVRGTQASLPGREGEGRRPGEGAGREVQGTQPEGDAALASVQPTGPTEAPDQSGVRKGYVRMVDAKGKSYITAGKRGARPPQPAALRAQAPQQTATPRAQAPTNKQAAPAQQRLFETPERERSGRDVTWYDYLRSPLSNLNYKGTYERLAGETGREISEAFRQTQLAIARNEDSRKQEIAKLERTLRGHQKQLRAEGRSGLANWLDAHVEALQDPDAAFRGLVGFLKKFQYDWKLRHNPRSIVVNLLQPLQTLWPHLSTAEFVKISAQARQKETRERIAELSARESGGKVEDINRDKKRWFPDVFGKVSESNRIMGHLAGELMADRLGLIGAQKARMAADWAKKVEFDNSRWDVPPLFRGRIASVVGQFKAFTIKNLERIYYDWKEQPEGSEVGDLARRAKMVTSQLAIGGVRSLLLPGIKEIAGVLILGGLANAFMKAGLDDDEADKWAEAIYFGAPGLVEQDLSSSVMLLDSPYGNTPSEKGINFLGGPTISLVFKAWKEGEAMSKAKDTAQGSKEDKIKASALRLSKAVTPYTKFGQTAYSLATTGKPPKLRLGKEEVEMTTKEAIGYGAMGTPLRQTKFYEEEDAFDWQKRMLGQPAKPGHLRLGDKLEGELQKHGLDYSRIDEIEGDTEKTHRQRSEKVERWLKQYGGSLISSPRYKSLTTPRQKAALETLRRRIGDHANQRAPILSNLATHDIIRSTLESEREKPARDRRKIVVAPD